MKKLGSENYNEDVYAFYSFWKFYFDCIELKLINLIFWITFESSINVLMLKTKKQRYFINFKINEHNSYIKDFI